MEVNGKGIKMRDLGRQLEQQLECRRLESELEQRPDELELECRVPLRLQGLKPLGMGMWSYRDVSFQPQAKSTAGVILVVPFPGVERLAPATMELDK
jgi:hypothetical protein